MLDLVGMQELKWDGNGTELAGEYTLFYKKGTESRIRYSCFCE
jgi:hypothetical protein